MVLWRRRRRQHPCRRRCAEKKCHTVILTIIIMPISFPAIFTEKAAIPANMPTPTARGILRWEITGGVEALRLPLDTADGCSLLMVNTKKAESLLQNMQSLQLVETTLEQATHCNGQLKAPSKTSDKREALMAEYVDLNGAEIQGEYMKRERRHVVKGVIKALIPYRLKRIVRSRRSAYLGQGGGKL